MYRKQTAPLKKKLTKHQLEVRALNIATRRDNAITRGLVVSVVTLLRRPLLGRLKWVFVGR